MPFREDARGFRDWRPLDTRVDQGGPTLELRIRHRGRYRAVSRARLAVATTVIAALGWSGPAWGAPVRASQLLAVAFLQGRPSGAAAASC